MLSMPLAARREEAVAAIMRFAAEARGSVLDQLGMFRAWYAVKDGEGRIKVAPSLFAGYPKLTADNYETARSGGLLDVRKSEQILAMWFGPPPSDQEAEEYRTALREFCGVSGRSPSRLSRLSVLRAAADNGAPGKAAGEGDPRALAEALYRIHQAMPQAAQIEFLRLLKR